MASLNKPFDLLFKHTLGSDIALEDFVRHHLPEQVYQRIDPHSIRPTKQSYVPPELRELHSDLVCTCTIDRQEALLILLVEHQSQASWLMPLRFIKYQAAAIEDFLQGKPQETPWPIVVCACFYHGKESPYPYSSSMYDYFTDPALAQEIGVFAQFKLIDLTVMGAEQMQKHGSLALMEQILKCSRERDFLSQVKELLLRYKDSLLSLEGPLGSDYWYAVYLVVECILEKLGYSGDRAADLFAESLALSKSKEEIMNVTQAIKQEGIERGEQNKALGIARNLLRKNMDVSFISETTGLDTKTITKLKEDKA